MKKLSMILALAALTFSAGAQTLNVQSAIQDLKKNYLKKAKAEIDLACEHESTKDDAKTWCYKGLIYSRIGGEASNPKSKFKDLAPDWAEQAYAAALECKRLDTKNEYATRITRCSASWATSTTAVPPRNITHSSSRRLWLAPTRPSR